MDGIGIEDFHCYGPSKEFIEAEDKLKVLTAELVYTILTGAINEESN